MKEEIKAKDKMIDNFFESMMMHKNPIKLTEQVTVVEENRRLKPMLMSNKAPVITGELNVKQFLDRRKNPATQTQEEDPVYDHILHQVGCLVSGQSFAFKCLPGEWPRIFGGEYGGAHFRRKLHSGWQEDF